MYAVVKTGGKQYKVSEGDMLKIEKLDGVVGDTVELDQVLMVGGEQIRIGTPVVPGATVVGRIVEQGKNKKILVFKFKRRKNSRKLNGHRQLRTILKIEKINA
ncbi:MAG: 50S ribosomal protein L21 [Geobacteraceae bacterium]|jgi:large subunit ribosomal protein L21